MVLFSIVRFLIGEQLSGKQQATEWHRIGN